MQITERSTVRLPPYRRRHTGLSVGELFELKQIVGFITGLQRICVQMPICFLRGAIPFLIFGLFRLVLGRSIMEIEVIMPVDARNKNRLFDSFTEEDCWHHLRFRKAELSQLFTMCEFPAVVICSNGSSCSGEHAFCLMLYRLAYPSRLIELQDIFGRDY